MTPPARTGTAWLALALAPALGGVGGCLDPGSAAGDVTVATTWSAPDRAQAEAAYRKAGSAGRVRWVVLDPSDDPTRLARLRRPPDVVLGGPASSYAARQSGRSFADEPGWRVARRVPVGLVFANGREPDPATLPEYRSRSAFDDPRTDPAALAALRAELAAGPWPVGYARLVKWAGGTIRPGWLPATAAAAVRRGTAGSTAAVAAGWNPVGFVSSPGWTPLAEGVAVCRQAPHPGPAQAFVEGLVSGGLAEPPTANDADRDGLLADLLGATLVDAREELLAAWDALERAGHPDKAEQWMTAPPPWPPASAARVLDRMPLVETLAGQLAPEADVRAWLLRSWLAPARPVDRALLDEIAGAVDGRLAREPRFRAWLRSEWAAWAGQRYRRVARTAGGRWTPPPEPNATPARPEPGGAG